MQRTTVSGIRIRSPADARVIFHSVFLNIFPMVTRRLDTEEKSRITTGSVYVWEEKGPYAELTVASIERWTDGIHWGPSRLRDGFLFYNEQPALRGLHTESPYEISYRALFIISSINRHPYFSSPRTLLSKKTYSVYIDVAGGRRKWHLTAYFTEETGNHLRDIDDIPQLANLAVPHGKYKSARIGKGRPEPVLIPESESRGVEYMPSAPGASPPIASPTPQNHLKWPNILLGNGSIPRRGGAASANSSDDSERESSHREALVPLSHLQSHPSFRRHPVDEKILMLLNSRGFCSSHTRPV
ncbi:hypothetical protein GALMADRAFT_1345912 [Galerina marginata CBS 339.88]|uniref:Gti1/Pac2 family-domain-containing protein n=1 Tax=Galerina marginata (strain CBS 339.88) TaxID=685588 RepID=A0A067SW82_GALM3|nr:hypothetical protein GALMADRAFT_1345912 [Galerina marginata CBS 339.88]